MNRIQNSMAEAFDPGVSPEKWHLAKTELYAWERSIKLFESRFAENEIWQFQHLIWAMQRYLFPSKDEKVAQACENGQQDNYCVYYTFHKFAKEVDRVEKVCNELRNTFRASKPFENRDRLGLIAQISEIHTMLDNLRAAPLNIWEKEPGFKDTQRQLLVSSFIFDEICFFAHEIQKQRQEI